jgi:hypothetical protein
MSKPPAIVVFKVGHLLSQSITRARKSLPTNDTSTGRWHALPGEVLELHDTGWQIKLYRQTFPDQSVLVTYQAINPEGVAVAASQTELQHLKAWVERQAADRKDFQL